MWLTLLPATCYATFEQMFWNLFMKCIHILQILHVKHRMSIECWTLNTECCVHWEDIKHDSQPNLLGLSVERWAFIITFMFEYTNVYVKMTVLYVTVLCVWLSPFANYMRICDIDFVQNMYRMTALVSPLNNYYYYEYTKKEKRKLLNFCACCILNAECWNVQYAIFCVHAMCNTLEWCVIVK